MSVLDDRRASRGGFRRTANQRTTPYDQPLEEVKRNRTLSTIPCLWFS
jgi:hypothetical protein